jgi:hypothetical protein
MCTAFSHVAVSLSRARRRKSAMETARCEQTNGADGGEKFTVAEPPEERRKGRGVKLNVQDGEGPRKTAKWVARVKMEFSRRLNLFPLTRLTRGAALALERAKKRENSRLCPSPFAAARGLHTSSQFLRHSR